MKAVLCPQCGAPLLGKPKNGIIICSYCNTPIQVTNRSNTTNENGKRIIRDINTGEELGAAFIPDNWNITGCIDRRFQSAVYPITSVILAQPPDKKSELSFRGGEFYKQIVESPMRQHEEGGFDVSELHPLRYFRTVEQFSDETLMRLYPKANQVSLINAETLPPYDDGPTINFGELREKYKHEYEEGIRSLHMPNAQVNVNNTYFDGGIRTYSYTDGSVRKIAAVSTAIRAIDSTMTIFGPLWPDINRYILWDVLFTIVYTAQSEQFDSGYGAFKHFVASLKLSDSYYRTLENEKNKARQSVSDYIQNESRNWQRYNAALCQQNDALQQRLSRERNSQPTSNFNSDFISSGDVNDRVAEMQSEAIRGMNTYMRDDGSEVEYSVANERVFGYNNDGKITFGTDSKSFEPGSDWTELGRKYN